MTGQADVSQPNGRKEQGAIKSEKVKLTKDDVCSHVVEKTIHKENTVKEFLKFIIHLRRVARKNDHCYNTSLDTRGLYFASATVLHNL